MYQLLLALYLLVALLIIFLILTQQGKGVEAGILGGINGSDSLLGATGSHFIVKLTAVLAILFFSISLILGNLSQTRRQDNKWENLENPTPLAAVESHKAGSKPLNK